MKHTSLKLALVLSLLLNLGVIGAVAYRAIQHGQLPDAFRIGADKSNLAEMLKLDAGQRRQWEALEAGFLRELKSGWQPIRQHREALVREIFSEQPDRGRIEAERAAIAQLQSAQQQRIIEQLLRERDVLDGAQRRQLADLLLRQAPASTFEERLHGK
ncbi:MAG: periplasmic heavy metal sensor [Betaproteobacteria bacterium]|nr:periplasmic heavy metal sensor [Betaproteobacteria bacterium]